MDEKILLGRGQHILEVPQTMWKEHLAQAPEHGHDRLSFMTEAHRQVRYFVVKEMAIRQKPVEPNLIAERLKLPLDQVTNILDELEKELTFLVRNEQGAVSWAYPVTVEITPHRLSFNSGEQLYAA
jgi:hydroxymethylpyrimidine pyrophosphatase-like HAD family hydrolase